MISPIRSCAGVAVALASATAFAQPIPEPPPDPSDPLSPDVDPDPSDPVYPRDPIPPVPPAPDPVTEDVPQPMPEPRYITSTELDDGDDDFWGFNRLGFAVSAGGGVQGFTGDTLRSATQDGGNWDVRVAIGTRSALAFEASYLGSAQTIDALGLDDDAVLMSNGVQGNLRLNVLPRGEVQPFVFAGAAWRRYDITDTDTNTSDIDGEDNVLEIPMGVGVAWHYRGLLLDARGEFRAATEEDLMPSLTASSPDDKANMHRYGVNANIGYEF